MALTKEQKKKQVELGVDLIKKSKSLVFADFTGVDTASIRKMKTEIKKAGASFKVIKKRLLNIALKNAGINYDVLQFPAQVGTIFAKEELSSFAAMVLKFSKDLVKAKKEFKVLGGFDVANNLPVAVEEFTTIAKLPTREVLLSMVLGGILGPLRAFMNIVKQMSDRVTDPDSDRGDKKVPAAPVAPAAPVE